MCMTESLSGTTTKQHSPPLGLQIFQLDWSIFWSQMYRSYWRSVFYVVVKYFQNIGAIITVVSVKFYDSDDFLLLILPYMS